MTVFSYSGRVKSPEWRCQRSRADLRHFEIFRHVPIMIYTRLPAWGIYYPICTFPASSECLIGISDAFSAFCLRVSVILPTCSLYPQQKRAYSVLHPRTWTYTAPCSKALTEYSPLDFRRSFIVTLRLRRKGRMTLGFIVQELCESRWPSWAVRPNEPSGFRRRKATLNHASALVSACP